MIFSESFFTVSEEIGAGHVICVYQGEQPSIEDFITNYNTSYNFASSNILKLIVKSSGSVDFVPTGIVTNPDSQGYTQAIKSFRSGTATWASIQVALHIDTNRYMNAQYNLDGYYFLSDNDVVRFQEGIKYEQNNYLTIVPVSDLTDNGVIKFRSIEFEHPNIADEDRAIDMSIIGSRS